MHHLKSLLRWGLGLVVAVVLGSGLLTLYRSQGRGHGLGVPTLAAAPVAFNPQVLDDPFDGGIAWLNAAGPIKLRELKGKVVLLDFWTYCCINCHHVLPDLAKLEEKYKDSLVVIGVHTPKFDAESSTENIRQKVREYRIKHPVVSDANMTIWNRFGVSSWPTLVLIDTEGKILGGLSGEGHYDVLDKVIGDVVDKARANKTLDETPVKFFPENEKSYNTPLLYPGKVLADAASNRLFVSDTGHNRVIVSDLGGKNPQVIGNGGSGLVDGSFTKAEFNRPQGMVLVGETLYVADTENHAVRAVDLAAKTVTTVAGTGKQAQRVERSKAGGPALETALNSPWDLAHVADSKVLYIAMAGPHQIWTYDIAAKKVALFAGTGMENIGDGPAASADFAQPSGLATDGKHLFVADSEGSCVRSIVLAGSHPVSTLAGEHDVQNVLFSFGDKDGKGTAVRFQHCLGVAHGEGKVYVADTYNNKIKVINFADKSVTSLVGDRKPGDTDDPPRFYQPGGLSVAGTKLYVADANNQAVRVVDLETRAVSTLALDGLTPPAPPARRPAFPNATVAALDKVEVAPGSEVTLDVTLPIKSGFKLNAESPLPYVVDAGESGFLAADMPVSGGRVSPPSKEFPVKVKFAKPAKAGDSTELKLSVAAFVCNEGSNLCTIKSYVWTLPVTFTDGGAARVAVGP